MPEKRIERNLDDDTTTYEFQPSPKMSTYLLAWCVGEFDFIGGTTKSGVSIRCYSVPGKAQQLKFSLDVALRSLEVYNEFF